MSSSAISLLHEEEIEATHVDKRSLGERTVSPNYRVSNADALGVSDRVISRTWFRRMVALLCAIPLIPAVGLNFPVAFILTALVAPLSAARRVPAAVWFLSGSAALGAVSFAGSALLNGSAFSVSSIGNFGVVAVLLIGFAKMTTSTDTVAQLVGYIAIVTVGYYVLTGGGEARGDSGEELWKYSFGTPVTVAVIFLATKRNLRGLSVGALLVLALVNFFENSRSSGLICIATASIVIVYSSQRTRRSIIRVVLALLALLALAYLVPLALSSGVFGAEVQARTENQAASPGGILLGGRTESPLSIAAILAKPLFGWGISNAINSNTIYSGEHLASLVGLTDPSQYLNFWIRSDGFVSLHSILLGSWAEGGVISALFPIALVIIFIKSILRVRGQFAPMVVFVSIQGIWDLFFSPWSDNRGVILAASAVLAIMATVDTQRASFNAKPSPSATTPLAGQELPRQPRDGHVQTRPL